LMTNFPNATDNIWLGGYKRKNECLPSDSTKINMHVLFFASEAGVLLTRPDGTTDVILRPGKLTDYPPNPTELTLCIPDEGNYTLALLDTYGDGWNNGLEAGSECLPQQECLDTVTNAGAFGQFCYCGYSIEMTDPLGNTVLDINPSAGGGFDSGFEYTTTLMVAADKSVTYTGFEGVEVNPVTQAINDLMHVAFLGKKVDKKTRKQLAARAKAAVHEKPSRIIHSVRDLVDKI